MRRFKRSEPTTRGVNPAVEIRGINGETQKIIPLDGESNLSTKIKILTPAKQGISIWMLSLVIVATFYSSCEAQQVYGFGNNVNVQFGIDYSQRWTSTIVPGSTSFTGISAGQKQTLFLAQGQVFGTGGRQPSLIFEISTVSIKDISAGYGFSLMLAQDGKVYSTGSNGNGELGLHDIVQRTTPALVQTPGITVQDISAGNGFSLILSNSGDAFSFGSNSNGQLGQNDLINRWTPSLISIVPPRLSITAISAGGYHSLMLSNKGEVYSFGRNSEGQLGLGDTIVRSTPTLLATDILSITAISSGWYHSLMLSNSGSCYSSGRNTNGQLGLGDNLSRTTAALIMGMSPYSITKISAGSSHSLMLQNNGRVFSFGGNSYGQLGIGDTTDRRTPTSLADLALISISAISAGDAHSAMLSNNFNAFTTGSNTYQQLGIGDGSLIPIPTILPVTSVSSVATGAYHSIFQTSQGLVYGAGDNYYGALGLSDTANRFTPTRITTGVFSTVTMLSVSSSTYFSLFCGSFYYSYLNNGYTYTYYCYNCVYSTGYNGYGQLGIGDTYNRYTPTWIYGLPSISAVSAGDAHSLFLSTSGRVLSVGNNQYGQLGTGDTANRYTPTLVTAGYLSSITITMMSGGYGHSLYMSSAQKAYSVGYNNNGQLGVQDTTNRLTPTLIAAGLSSVSVAYISAGNYHSLMLSTKGFVYSFGDNSYGQLGMNDTIDRATPSLVSTLMTISISSVSAGSGHSILSFGRNVVFAAGLNANGQLGLGDSTDRYTPSLIGTIFSLNQCVNQVTAKRLSSFVVVSGNATTNCPDINECTLSTHNCSTNAVCTNTIESFACSCNTGYTGNGINCVDINECTSSTHNCVANAACTNTAGSFTCGCNAGYSGNGASLCNDINECTSNTTIHNCNTNARCSNTAGSFTCSCNVGYTGNGVSCGDVDECTLNKHNCYVVATCTNTAGSFTCSCNVGFTGSGLLCSDIDECSLRIHNCNVALSSCQNTVSSYSCTCFGGYQLNSTSGPDCIDINECSTGTHKCHPDATCTNTIGSFTCACNVGYNGNGVSSCVDIDECTSNTTIHNCDPHARCTNTIGSFACSCNLGYSGNGVSCADMNECTSNTHNCNTNATCTNTEGSFTCACNVGYNGNGLTCDYDECASNKNNCDSYAACTNTIGSFTCACNIGYNGNGVDCQPYSKFPQFFAFGSNTAGELGMDDAYRTTPTEVRTESYAKAMAAGESHSLVLTTAATVLSTGNNQYGQLGLADVSNRFTPTLIPLTASISAISAGGSHSLLLSDQGRVYVMGSNKNGQLGIGESNDCYTPTLLSSGISSLSFVSIAGGFGHSMLLSNSGYLFSSGWNSNGQLALGDSIDRYTPTLVSFSSITIASIAAGYANAFVLSNGKLYASGSNSNGQLGLGDKADRWALTLVTGAPSIVSSVRAGQFHSLILATGNVYGIGRNDVGQLGLSGGNVDKWTPTLLGLSSIKFISVGYSHSLVISNDGRIYGTGQNFNGELGLGDKTNRNSTSATMPEVTFSSVSGGGKHSLLLASDGRMLSTGSNSNGQLGLGDSKYRILPTTTQGGWFAFANITSVASGGGSDVATSHSLVLSAGGHVFGTGANGNGQLGLGDTLNRNTPALIGSISGIQAISAGGAHSLMLSSQQQLYASGSNYLGQLGVGDSLDRSTPVLVASKAITAAGVVGISAGGYHSLLLSSSGQVYSTGQSSKGQLGLEVSNPVTRFTPTLVNLTTTAIQMVSAGNQHSLLLSKAGNVFVFGYNAYGQLGLGDSVDRFTPSLLSSRILSSVTFTSVSGGGSHTLLLSNAGLVYSAGANGYGQLGINDTTTRYTPTLIVPSLLMNSGIMFIETGFNHSIFYFGGRIAYSSGSNRYGQLGVGDTQSRITPTLISLGSVCLNAIATGGSHSVAIGMIDGTVCNDDNECLNYTGKLRHDQNATCLNTFGSYRCLCGFGYQGDGVNCTDVDECISRLHDCDAHADCSNTQGSFTCSCRSGYIGDGLFCLSKNTFSISKVFSTGANADGQLGLGDTEGRMTPTLAMIGVLSSMDVSLASAGERHAMALSAIGGHVYSFGDNTYGQLGLGDVARRSTATLLSSHISSVLIAVISSGTSHSLLVSQSAVGGYVYGTGNNDHGQLGLGDVVFRTTPALITAGGISSLTVSMASGGRGHTLFGDINDIILSTGSNKYGQLGLGDVTDRYTPSLVPFSSSATMSSISIASIFAGGDHSLMLSNSGKVYSTGYNGYGQLGLGDVTDRYTPTLLPFSAAMSSISIASIFAGGDCSMMLSNSGKVYSTGYNGYGQLGLGDTKDRYTPALVTELSSVSISTVSMQNYHAIFLSSSNTAYSAGTNTNGQLGLGDLTCRHTPTLIKMISSVSVSSVATGLNFTILRSPVMQNTDVDECSRGSHNCDAHATCMNIVGSFLCTCNVGYIGNGLNCTNNGNSTVLKGDTIDVYPTSEGGLSRALSASRANTIIRVHAGLYNGTSNCDLRIQKPNITLLGTNGPLETIIDCRLASRCLSVVGNFGGVNIVGIQFRNGKAANSGILSPASQRSKKKESRDRLLPQRIRKKLHLVFSVSYFVSPDGNLVSNIKSNSRKQKKRLESKEKTTNLHPTVRAKNSIQDSIGGCILVLQNSTLMLSNVIIQGGQATKGGGIGCSDSTITISDSIINSNIVSGNADGDYYGGGAYLYNSAVAISNTNFSGNTIIAAGNSILKGGGLMIENCNQTSLVGPIIATQNQLNTSSSSGEASGGAISIIDSDGLTLTGPIFVGNNRLSSAGAALNGGGVYIESSNNLQMIGEFEIVDNSAASIGGSGYLCGGGIALSSCNQATLNGSFAISRNALYTSGVGSRYGGSTHFYRCNSLAVIGSLTASDNSISSEGGFGSSFGGSLYLELYSTGTFNASLFMSNNSISSKFGNAGIISGGGLYVIFSTVTFRDTVFAENNALVNEGGSNSCYGGAVYFEQSSSAMFYGDVRLSNNSVTSSGSGALKGGALCLVNCKEVTFVASISILDNRLISLPYHDEPYNSPAMSPSSAASGSRCLPTTIENSAGSINDGFSDNYQQNMNCFWLIQPTKILQTFSKLSFKIAALDTEADRDFLYLFDGDTTTSTLIGKYSGSLSGPKCNGGSCTDLSASVYPQSGSLLVHFTTDGGNAGMHSGFILNWTMVPRDLSSQIGNTIVLENYNNYPISVLGGGINIDSTDVSMHDGLISGNEISSQFISLGGGVAIQSSQYAVGSKSVTMKTMTFSRNRVVGINAGGGAIAVMMSSSLGCDQCLFESNSAVAEGQKSCFYAPKQSSTLCLSSFGGSVFSAFQSSATNISNSRFLYSSADCTNSTGCSSYGGAVATFGIPISVTRTNCTHCTSLYAAGCMYIEGGSAAIANSKFLLNSVTSDSGNGGAISVSGKGTNCQLRNCSINSNFAHFGGGMNVDGTSSVVILDSVFSENNASIAGALVAKGESHMSLNNIALVDNTAVRVSGMLSFNSKGFSVSNSSGMVPLGSSSMLLGTLDFVGNTLNCSQPGTVFVKDTTSEYFSLTCVACTDGTYSVDAASTLSVDRKCLSCPFGGRCEGSNATSNGLYALTDFYGSKNFSTGEVSFYLCPQGYCCPLKLQNCSYNYCHGNRTDLLCGECGDGMGMRFFTDGCKPNSTCDFKNLYVWLAILGCAVLIVLGLLLTTGSESSGLLSVTLYFYQVLPMVKSTAWKYASPSFVIAVQSVFNLSPSGGSDDSEGICLMPSMKTSHKFGTKMLFQGVVFSVMISIFFLHWAIGKCFPRGAPALSHYIATAARFCTIAYTTLVLVPLQMIQCVEVNHVKVWWWDASVQCFESWQIYGFAAMGILIPLPLIEILWFCVRWRNREALAKEYQKRMYTVLTSGYRQERRWWLGVSLYRRLLMVVAYSAILDSNWKSMANMALCALFLTLNFVLRPFKSRVTHLYESWSLLSLLLLAISTSPQLSVLQFGIKSQLSNEMYMEWAQFGLIASPLAGYILIVCCDVLLFLKMRLFGRRRLDMYELQDMQTEKDSNVVLQVAIDDEFGFLPIQDEQSFLMHYFC